MDARTPLAWFSCGEDAIPDGIEWLSAAERGRQATMRFTKRRTEYLLRRCVGKRAVAILLDLPSDPAGLARVALLNAPGGAPYVEVDGVRPPLEVSLTDRAGQAVALVGPTGSMAQGALGIDLEIVEPRSLGFVSDFLTCSEQRWVRAEHARAGDDGWNAAANLLWSAKEAALKVQRVGLRADTRTVEVTAQPVTRTDGWGALAIRSTSGEHFTGWWRRDGHYVLTLATRNDLPPPNSLPGSAALSEAVPTHSWLAQPLA